ncbi:MAG: hypothetical protein R3B09_22825 [Nannocystaceae bacterium]
MAPQVVTCTRVVTPDPDLVARACLHCDATPDPPDWQQVEIPFRAGDARWSGPAEITEEEARLVALMKERPDLALRLLGDRRRREPKGLGLRRAEAMRQRFTSFGVRDGQLAVQELDPHEVSDPQVVIGIGTSVPEPVALGEACGTEVLAVTGEKALADAMAARGWQLRLEGPSQVERATGGIPLRGSRLANLAYLADGFVELHGSQRLLQFAGDGSLRREQRARVPPFGERGAGGLASSPEGYIVAWSPRIGQMCTIVIDDAGEPTRPEHCESLVDTPIADVAIDYAHGAGAIVFTTAGATGHYGHAELIPIDAQGLPLGAMRTLALSTDGLSQVAIAVLGPDQISALVSTCGQFVARIDVNARGEVLATDRRFLRSPHWLGVATVVGPSGAWGLSIADAYVDVRPLCPLATVTR